MDMKVLIIDDNALVRRIIKSIVADPSVEVTEGEDGADALRLYDLCHPDLVLMDMKMKVMDGLSATREIIHAHPDAKVVIVTNYDDDQMREAARSAGAHALVAKDDLAELKQFFGENKKDLTGINE
jgi:two-component system response regulator DegU